MSRRNALGKGLGALLGDASAVGKTEYSAVAEKVNSIFEVDINKIEANPYQPRTDFDQEALNELAESIKTQGIIQPVTVRKLNSNSYQLISGERRYQASKIAGLKKIPAYVREANDQQMLEMGLVENIQRENLNAMEIALSYQRLISECNLKQDELGDRVGKKRATVTNYLRLLKLTPDAQVAIRNGRLSMGHARALVSVEEADKQLFVLSKILKDDLSVRQVEDLVRGIIETTKKKILPTKTTQPNSNDSVIKKLQSDLSSHFGTKVMIKLQGANKGEIKIPFVSTEDLNRILEIIK